MSSLFIERAGVTLSAQYLLDYSSRASHSEPKWKGTLRLMALEKYPMTRLKAARERRGFSQTYVAEGVGMTQSHLAKLEKGKVSASPEIATRLANFFGGLVTREEILYPDEYPVIDLGARKPVQQLQEA